MSEKSALEVECLDTIERYYVFKANGKYLGVLKGTSLMFIESEYSGEIILKSLNFGKLGSIFGDGGYVSTELVSEHCLYTELYFKGLIKREDILNCLKRRRC